MREHVTQSAVLFRLYVPDSHLKPLRVVTRLMLHVLTVEFGVIYMRFLQTQKQMQKTHTACACKVWAPFITTHTANVRGWKHIGYLIRETQVVCTFPEKAARV